jgi:hypothetical protein
MIASFPFLRKASERKSASTLKGDASTFSKKGYFFLGFVMDDFFAIIIAAFRANVMGFDHRSAMGATDQAGHVELEVSSS